MQPNLYEVTLPIEYLYNYGGHHPLSRQKKLAQTKGNKRNEPCECGSGKKFKKCCWGKVK